MKIALGCFALLMVSFFSAAYAIWPDSPSANKSSLKNTSNVTATTEEKDKTTTTEQSKKESSTTTTTSVKSGDKTTTTTVTGKAQSDDSTTTTTSTATFTPVVSISNQGYFIQCGVPYYKFVADVSANMEGDVSYMWTRSDYGSTNGGGVIHFDENGNTSDTIQVYKHWLSENVSDSGSVWLKLTWGQGSLNSNSVTYEWSGTAPTGSLSPNMC